MAKLDKKKKAKWLKALRSGKYVQGAGALKKIVYDDNEKVIGHEYCCLGVACQIRIARATCEAFVSSHFLPDDVQTELANMNDGTNGKERTSFKQIAKWIEKNL